MEKVVNRMDGYIEKQAAIDVLHGYFDGMLETDTVCPADIYGLFECIPSTDVHPVVWCKDCDSAECSGVMIYCLTHGRYMRDNDYCSLGIRKDGEQNE